MPISLCERQQDKKEILYTIAGLKLSLKDRSILFEPVAPYKLIEDAKKNTRFASDVFLWQSIADALQTAAIDRQEDYKLKNLVETFGLAGNLIVA